jgi:uncharacterized protein (DUF433 family)
MNYLGPITFNPEQCGGRPCIRGVRIRVKDVLNLIGAGVSEKEILEDYPDLEAGDIKACLQYPVRGYVALGRPLSYHPFLQFNPVAEGVVNISSMEAFKRLVIFAGKSCITQPGRKSLQIVHHECRMCLRGGTKIVLYTEMHPHVAILKPTAATFSELLGFRHLGHAQRLGIEPPSSVFFPRWHRQLYMFNPLHCHMS